MRDFFAKAPENWDNPSGQLHIYALPERNFTHLVAPYLQVLTESSICAVQPRDSLHATVQRLPYFAEDGEIRKKIPLLGQAIRRHFAQWRCPNLEFQLPEVTEDSVLCYSRPTTAWNHFVEGVRQCAIDVLGDEAAHFSGVPRAHLTLAYGIADADSRDLVDQIDKINTVEYRHRSSQSLFYTMALDHAAVVTVHQNHQEGTYTFEPLAVFYLK